jgi:hypothetical protein
LPAFVVYGRPMTSYSPVSSVSRSRHSFCPRPARVHGEAALIAAGRVDRSRARRGRDAHRRGKRWTSAAGVGEALKGLLPTPLTGEPERDPAVEIDPIERNVRPVARRPPCIGQVLLRRVRDGARPQKEGEPAQPDDGRFQRCGSLAEKLRRQCCSQKLAALVEQALLDAWSARAGKDRGIVRAERGLEPNDQLELRRLLHAKDRPACQLATAKDCTSIFEPR